MCRWFWKEVIMTDGGGGGGGREVKAPKKGSPELERRRQWHGWAFRGYSKAECDAICHYIETGEDNGNLPRGKDAK